MEEIFDDLCNAHSFISIRPHAQICMKSPVVFVGGNLNSRTLAIVILSLIGNIQEAQIENVFILDIGIFANFMLYGIYSEDFEKSYKTSHFIFNGGINRDRAGYFFSAS